MNEQGEENLKELFERFLDSEQAEQAADDVQKAEQILSEHPAPKPDERLVANIKMKIAGTLVGRKRDSFRRAVYRTAAVAAAVIILAAVGVRLFEKGDGEQGRIVASSIIPATIWESEDIAEDDAELATLAAEIEQIGSEVLALRLGENGSNGSGAITELEIELIEINSDFWKG